DCREDDSPRDDHQNQLRPNTPADFPVADERSLPEKNAPEQERRESESCVELYEGGKTSAPARRTHDHKGPEFLIAFRGQVQVMCLMDGAIKGEAHETQRPGDNAVEFVQKSILSQQPVRGLVKPNQGTVHKMTGEQHEGHGQPDPAVKNSKAKRNLGGNKGGYD